MVQMMTRRSAIQALAGIGLGVTLLLSGPAWAEHALDRIKQQGYVDIGYANEAPFSFKTAAGEVIGVDVDVLKALLPRIGVKDVHAQLVTFGALIPGLKASRFDIVAAAMYIKPDRCKQVAFSEPMYILGDTIIVPKGNPKKILSYEDVAKDPSFRLGVPVGGTGVSDKAKALGVTTSQLVGFNDNPSGMEAIKAGRIDGFAATSLIAQAQLNALGDDSLQRAEPFRQPVINGEVAYGIPSYAMRPEDTDLVSAINGALSSFRATPEYMQILEKYGISKDDLPRGETVAKLCAPK